MTIRTQRPPVLVTRDVHELPFNELGSCRQHMEKLCQVIIVILSAAAYRWY